MSTETTTDVLTAVQTVLMAENLVLDSWSSTTDTWGAKVKEYREYQMGDHNVTMSDKMKALLNRDEAFVDNYCELVIDYIASRITCTGFTSGNENADIWLDAILQVNSFATMQSEISEAALVDGDTFVLVEFDKDTTTTRISHEPAWDSEQGMIPVYTSSYTTLAAAVKVWLEPQDGQTVSRVNIYYPDGMVRYTLTETGLTAISEHPWNDGGLGLGVPVFHFRNKKKTSRMLGRSKIANVLPLQDALNTTYLSMIMSGLLSSFGIRVLINAELGNQYLEPGCFLQFEETDPEKPVRVENLVAGSVREFIDEINLTVNEIGKISKTPMPDSMGSSSASGEALKQREIGLLAEVDDFHASNGAVYSALMGYLPEVHRVFGGRPAPVGDGRLVWKPIWEDPNPRSDSDIIADAIASEPLTGLREALRYMAPVRGWSNDDIERIMEERIEDEATLLSKMSGLPAVT